MNEYFFEIEVTQEQVDYTNRIVDYSIARHPIQDIFANDPRGKERQREFRFTGSLGEVVFADTYELKRPERAFGAIDGQDFGEDFILNDVSYDIKSMRRNNNNFRENYVLNLPKYQMDKNKKTDSYFCISIHEEKDLYIASFIGSIEKSLVKNGTVGILYKKGTKRVKDNGDYFTFMRDTYEVDFKDIKTPFINERIKSLKGYKMKKILLPFMR